MADSTNNSAAPMALGFLIGAAAGVTAGMLFAPKSGEEMRGQIKAKAYEMKDKAKDEAQQAKEGATTAATRVADKARAAVREGKEAAKNA